MPLNKTYKDKVRIFSCCESTSIHFDKKIPQQSRTNLLETLEVKAACTASGGRNHPQPQPQRSRGSQQQAARGMRNKQTQVNTCIHQPAGEKKEGTGLLVSCDYIDSREPPVGHV
ncbi:hypothetical protein GOODEAATRI_033913 [Goodea atripinnis]|uniref:Uncharacterized protein n=1 Tax=Goodea atripinnis TaxID=208336 RepID=A0ABV0MPV1_9TELE